MLASTRAFLGELLDYAGLFPPSEHSMEEAVQTFAAYRQSEYGWMLSRFICPAARLDSFEACATGRLGSGDPWRLSLLPSPIEGGQSLVLFEQEMAGIGEFHHRIGGTAVPDLLEVRVVAGTDSDRELFEQIVTIARETLPRFKGIFFEASAGPEWDSRAESLIQALSGVEGAGFKQRLGGVRAEAYPGVEQVAEALWVSHRARVPYKATAGLHHPVRYFREDLGVREHGFLNLFGAGVLLKAGAMNRGQLTEMLADEDPSSFSFDEKGFHYRELTASAGQIVQARRSGVLSYGSCSFDEPREDLRRLKVL